MFSARINLVSLILSILFFSSPVVSSDLSSQLCREILSRNLSGYFFVERKLRHSGFTGANYEHIVRDEMANDEEQEIQRDIDHPWHSDGYFLRLNLLNQLDHSNWYKVETIHPVVRYRAGQFYLFFSSRSILSRAAVLPQNGLHMGQRYEILTVSGDEKQQTVFSFEHLMNGLSSTLDPELAPTPYLGNLDRRQFFLRRVDPDDHSLSLEPVARGKDGQNEDSMILRPVRLEQDEAGLLYTNFSQPFGRDSMYPPELKVVSPVVVDWLRTVEVSKVFPVAFLMETKPEALGSSTKIEIQFNRFVPVDELHALANSFAAKKLTGLISDNIMPFPSGWAPMTSLYAEREKPTAFKNVEMSVPLTNLSEISKRDDVKRIFIVRYDSEIKSGSVDLDSD